jgi:hypothetical protein
MQRKFYKLLIIGNLQPPILHIQTRGVGGMGRWVGGKKHMKTVIGGRFAAMMRHETMGKDEG